MATSDFVLLLLVAVVVVVVVVVVVPKHPWNQPFSLPWQGLWGRTRLVLWVGIATCGMLQQDLRGTNRSHRAVELWMVEEEKDTNLQGQALVKWNDERNGSWMVRVLKLVKLELGWRCWWVVSHCRSTWGWWSVGWSLQRCGWWRQCLALWHPGFATAVAQGEAKDAAALRAWRSLSSAGVYCALVALEETCFFLSFTFQSCKMKKTIIFTSVSWIQSIYKKVRCTLVHICSVARPKNKGNDQSSLWPWLNFLQSRCKVRFYTSLASSMIISMSELQN